MDDGRLTLFSAMDLLADRCPRPLALVVEDDRGVCAYARRLLTREGYFVFPASNAREGMEAADIEHFAFALIDVELGRDMNGIDLALRLKETGQASHIVLMSGNPVNHARASRAGLRFIEKPFSPDQFRKLLRSP